jgi:HD-like signal output (HDOD) protein
MLGWIGSFRRASPPPRTTAAAHAAASAPTPAEPAAAPGGTDLPRPSALGWLLDGPDPRAAPPSEAERLLLKAVDTQLAAPRLPDDLLPRAAGVLPQLLALMRQEAPSRSAMVQQVLKDPLLTAEVLRVARSTYYGGQAVDTLEAALDRIGIAGLQAATARVLLKPVFQPQGEGLAVRAAPKLWQRAERKSLHCASAMAAQGGDRLEGLLAGLLHDTGWLALLRLMDRAGLGLEWPASRALDAALDRRKDKLFGRLALQWDLGVGLAVLAAAVQQAPLASLTLPLATALRNADLALADDLARPAEGADAGAA